MVDKITKTEEQWKEQLNPEEFRILREKDTEAPFTGEYYKNHENGRYMCKACGQELFDSNTKFDSGSGWPSFSEPSNTEHVELIKDDSHGMSRVEVVCKRCGSHLGHLFNDGPVDKGGMRYCINSKSLNFNKQADE